MGLVVLSVLEEHLVHVGAGVLVELFAAAEDDESYFTVTQHRELVSFFHHTKLTLVECDLKYTEKMKIEIMSFSIYFILILFLKSGFLGVSVYISLKL